MSSLIQLLDRPIAYNPALARLRAGKIKSGPVAAVFLSQMLYWHNRMEGEWMYKTRADIESETALTRDEQETARRRLVSLGVLEEKLRGVPATMHYRINAERLEELLLISTQSKSQIAAIPPSGRESRYKSVGGNPANKNASIPPTSLAGSHLQDGGDPANFHTGDYTRDYTENKNPFCPDALPSDEKISKAEFLKRHPEAVVCSPAKRQWGSQEDLTCAQWLWKRVLKLYEEAATYDGELVRPKEPNWTVWANDVRLMRTFDGRTHKQICEMFKRVQSDSFWIKRVRCPAKLREKWDDLVFQLNSNSAVTGSRDVNKISRPDSEIPPGFRG